MEMGGSMSNRRTCLLLQILLAVTSLVLFSSTGAARGPDVGPWSIDLPLWTTVLVVDPGDKATIYAGGAPHSDDDDRYLFKSTDGGQTWTDASNGLVSAIRSIAFDAGDHRVLYAGSFGGVFKSTDGGENWVRASEGLGSIERPLDVLALTADPAQPGVIYAGARGGYVGSWGLSVYHGGVYKSTDGGGTWHSSQTGILLPEHAVTPVEVSSLIVDPRNPATLYARTDRLYRSTDAGATWMLLANSPTGLGSSGINDSLVMDPRDSRVLYLANYSGTTTSPGGIYRSRDGGETWTWASGGLQSPMATSLVLDPENPDVLYAATGSFGRSGVYRSDNEGTSWNVFEPPLLAGMEVRALAITGSGNSKRFYAGTSSGVASTSIFNPSVFYFPHLGNGVSGPLRLRTNLMLANMGPEAAVQVDFLDTEGKPLVLQLGNREPSSSLHLILRPGDVFSEWTLGTGPLVSGYARVSAPPDVNGNVIFACEQDQQLLYETGVPAARAPSRDFTLFFDSQEGQSNVGVAVVNRGEQPATVRFRLYDGDFVMIAERTVNDILGADLVPAQSMAAYATEIFPEIGEQSLQTGTITVQSDQDLAALTLHQQQQGSTVRTSSFPIVPGRADRAGLYLPQDLTFPQIADGRQGDVSFRTEVVLINTGSDTFADVFFKGGLGSAREFDLEGLGLKSSVSVVLPKGRTVSLKTRGSGELQTGYATIFPWGDVRAFVVVVQSDAQSSTETTVMPSHPRSKFSFFFDRSEASVNTGLALAGSGDVSLLINVECKLYDESAQLITTRKFDFMPRGHYAQFATELFPEILHRKMLRGLITVESTHGELVPVVLREHLAPAAGFLKPLYRLTTLPVFPKVLE
jgi:photosystem II stability/assembly factor-like uncharacterized protein